MALLSTLLLAEEPAVAAPTAAEGCGTSATTTTATCLSEARPALNQDGTISGLYPADIEAAYGLTGARAGTGTVGVLIAYANPNLEADLAHYRATFGLPPCTLASGCLTITDQNGVTNARPAYDEGWGTEESLDVDAVSAACPGCRIIVVEARNADSNNLDAAADTAVRLGATVLSASYGSLENGSWRSETAHYTHPGVPTFAANGDGGDPRALYPAALPGVIAVGGTKLNAVNPFETHVGGWVRDTSGGSAVGALTVDGTPRSGTAAPLSTGGSVASLTAALAKARKAERTASRKVATAKRAVTAATKAVKRAHTRTTKRKAARTLATARSRATALRHAAKIAANRTAAARTALHAAERAADTARNSAGVGSAGSTAGASGGTPAPAPPTPSRSIETGSVSTGTGSVRSSAGPSPAPPATITPPAVTPIPAPPTTTPTPAPTVGTGGGDPTSTNPGGFAGYTETAWSHGEGGCSTFTPRNASIPDIGCGAYRTVVDVAAVAGTPLAVYDSAAGGWLGVGGTSLSAPVVAAIAARSGYAAALAVDAYDGQGGEYGLARASAAGRIHDVTTGGVTTCWVLTSCVATTGFDASTGFGTLTGLDSFQG